MGFVSSQCQILKGQSPFLHFSHGCSVRNHLASWDWTIVSSTAEIGIYPIYTGYILIALHSFEKCAMYMLPHLDSWNGHWFKGKMIRRWSPWRINAEWEIHHFEKPLFYPKDDAQVIITFNASVPFGVYIPQSWSEIPAISSWNIYNYIYGMHNLYLWLFTSVFLVLTASH